MTRLAYLFLLLCLVACSKDDASDNPTPPPARRTVVVYMSGENNLESYDYLESDLAEMKTGRRLAGEDERLVVFVDKLARGVKPFLAQVTTDGRLDTLYRYGEDFYSSDPAQMSDVLRKAITLCPATEDYGLVLWGHANSWLIERDSIAMQGNRAYGYDTGEDKGNGQQGRWMNIPTLRMVLASLPVRWKFIFCDCCNMLSAEVAYELRQHTDYLIGSPAEIPGIGAPYQQIVKDLFCHDDATMYTGLCDHYFTQTGDNPSEHPPLAVVKTAALPQLAAATRQVLPHVAQYLENAQTPTDGTIYYYGDPKNDGDKSHYDMKDVISRALSDEPTLYLQWAEAFRQAVVYSIPSTYWQTGRTTSGSPYVRFSDFTELRDGTRTFKHGDECCGVMSMFFPMERYNSTNRPYNEDIKQLGWYYAAGWQETLNFLP